MKKIIQFVLPICGIAMLSIMALHRLNHAELNSIQYFISYWHYCLLGVVGGLIIVNSVV